MLNNHNSELGGRLLYAKGEDTNIAFTMDKNKLLVETLMMKDSRDFFYFLSLAI